MHTHECPASVGQRLLRLMERYRGGGDGTFNEPLVWRLRGPLRVSALDRALTSLFERHEALRTTMVDRGRQVVQVVNEPRPAGLVVEDLRAGADPDAEMRSRLQHEIQQRIDVASWPVRVRLWRVADAEHVLCLTMHHLVTDYRSLWTIRNELATQYIHETSGGPPAAAPAWQYRDWVGWQRALLSEASLRDLQRYWEGRLTGMRPFPLPSIDAGPDEGPDGPAAAGTGTVDVCRFWGEQAVAMHRLAEQQSASLLAVTLSVFYALVHSATALDDITVASIFSNRQPAEVADTVGFFENMVLLRQDVRPEETFRDLVRRVHAGVVAAEEHQGLPFHLLPPSVTRTATGPDGRRPDSIVFNIIRFPLHPIDLGDVTAEEFVPENEHRTARYGLRVVVMDGGDGIVVMAVYDNRITGWVRHLACAYQELGDRVLADPTTTVGELGALWRALTVGAAP